MVCVLRTWSGKGADFGDRFLNFQLTPGDVSLPLGWMLSGNAAADMLKNLPVYGTQPVPEKWLYPAVMANASHMQTVMTLLDEARVK